MVIHPLNTENPCLIRNTRFSFEGLLNLMSIVGKLLSLFLLLFFCGCSPMAVPSSDRRFDCDPSNPCSKTLPVILPHTLDIDMDSNPSKMCKSLNEEY